MRSALLALPLILVAACGSDTVKPGDIVVNWSHGPTATCDSRHVVSIEARAYAKTKLVGSAQGTCPAAAHDGTIALNDIPPGSYTIEVEASDASGKGLYLGSVAKQAVKEGGATESSVVTLVQKPVQLNITWSTPTGMCAASPVREVLVQYIPNASTVAVVEDEEKVACDNEIQDPKDPSKLLAGVLFVDLVPNSDVKVFVYGLDVAGKKIAKGETDTLSLQPGDAPTLLVPLVTCPGTPPACD